MKKINLLIAIAMLMFVSSCDKDEDNEPKNTFETTDVLALIESGDNSASRGVNRPGTVLDFINTIEITADHVETIGPAYKVSETYEMKDDGSGASNFVLEDVALGRNKFEAFAYSYNQTPTQEYKWVIGEADNPWEYVDAQRLRHPNVNFNDTDNAAQVIYENPTAVQNIVNFDMKAESGRLIVAVRLGDKIRNKFNSNYVYVQHQVKYADGTKEQFTHTNGGTYDWSEMNMFNNLHKDDLLSFYFSDNEKSIDGACVKFRFVICDDERPGIVTNEFFREICIENGKSIGCVYEIDEDAVIEDVTNFNFQFDWEEVDCAPCPSNAYVTTVPRYSYIQNEMLELCGLPVGSFHDVTDVVPADMTTNWHLETVLNVDGSLSNVVLVVSSPDRTSDLYMQWDQGITIPIGKSYLVALPKDTVVHNISVDWFNIDPRPTGTILGCN